MAKKEKSEAAEKVAKAAKPQKVKKPNSENGNIFTRIWTAIAKFAKDFKSEIKKIVWPERKTVLKSTGVVLAMVAIIGVIIFGIDTGLTAVIKELSKLAADSAVKETTKAAAETPTQALTQATTAVQNAITAATQAITSATGK